MGDANAQGDQAWMDASLGDGRYSYIFRTYLGTYLTASNILGGRNLECVQQKTAD